MTAGLTHRIAVHECRTWRKTILTLLFETLRPHSQVLNPSPGNSGTLWSSAAWKSHEWQTIRCASLVPRQRYVAMRTFDRLPQACTTAPENSPADSETESPCRSPEKRVNPLLVSARPMASPFFLMGSPCRRRSPRAASATLLDPFGQLDEFVDSSCSVATIPKSESPSPDQRDTFQLGLLLPLRA